MNLRFVSLFAKASATYLLPLALLAVAGSAGAAQPPTPPSPPVASEPAPSPGPLTSAEARADFDLMRRALEEAHTGLYRYTPKAEMDRVFAAERAKLGRPIGKPEFLAVIAETLARIRCGHTGFSPDPDSQRAFDHALMLPLQGMLEGRRWVVIANRTPDNATIRPGMEVLEINGHKVGEVLDRAWPTVNSDGDIDTGKRLHIQNGFARDYWWRVERPDSFIVKARGTDGKVVVATLAGSALADQEKTQNPVNDTMQSEIEKLRGPKENQTLRFLKDPDVAEIRLRYFVGDDYPKWMEETFKTLREKGTKALVIDLRGNGGGQDMYGAMLVSYLTDKPFRYFDHIDLKTFTPSFKAYTDFNLDPDQERDLREKTIPLPGGGYRLTSKLHPGLAVQQPGKNPFLGKVFVLTNGRTFSTAADFCAVTHHLKRATFIGEETGGGYYGNNSGMEAVLTLPNSKVKVGVPMFEYWNAVPGYPGKRRGTRPDYPVEMKAADLLRGVDAPLELALKLADTHRSDAERP